MINEMEINELVSSYEEYIAKIADGSLNIAENLRMEKYKEAFTQIINFAEGLDWLLKVESVLIKHQIEVNNCVKEASAILAEINEALQEKDYVHVADLFEYEIVPLFELAN